MRRVRKFQTVSEFNEAYNGEQYSEPWLSLTVENEHVDYNKRPVDLNCFVRIYDYNLSEEGLPVEVPANETQSYPVAVKEEIRQYINTQVLEEGRWSPSNDTQQIVFGNQCTGIGNLTGGFALDKTDDPLALNFAPTIATLGPSCMQASMLPYTDIDFSICTGMTNIPVWAFYGVTCKSLNLPDSITTMADAIADGCGSGPIAGCFSYMRTISALTLSSGLTRVGSFAFAGSSFQEITLGPSVTHVGASADTSYFKGYAFSECSALTSITCYAPTAPTLVYGTTETASTNFQGTPDTGVLRVPTGSNYSSWLNALNAVESEGTRNWTIQYIQ